MPPSRRSIGCWRAQPGDPSLRSQRAFVLLNLGRNEEALTAAEHALAVQPTGVWPQLLRATALRFLGRRATRLAAAEQVAASAPHDPAVRLELARCQLAARKRKQAEQTAMAVVADLPTSVAGWIEVGQTRASDATTLQQRTHSSAPWRSIRRLRPPSTGSVPRYQTDG